MTTSAREVLVYCNLAAKRLKEISFDDTQDWRLGWVTVLTLLRAVGHVFDKVDKSQYDLSYRNKIKEYWEKKKEEPIFKEFIENARNLLLKQFDFEHITPTQFNMMTEKDEVMITESGARMVTQEYIYFKNNREKTVDQLINEALNWWENYLDEIDRLTTTQ